MTFRKIFIACMLYIIMSPVSFATPQLLVHTDNNEIEYGRPLRVEIIGIELKEKLSAINIKPLYEQYEVIPDYSAHNVRDKRWPNQTVQRMQFKLYARKTGKITIPVLSVGNVHSKEKHINVIPGNTQLRDINFTSQTPYVHEQVIVKITLQSDSSNARLNIRKSAKNSSFDVVPLEFSRKKSEKNKYFLEVGLSVTPLVSGKLAFILPAIEYSVDGVLRKLFYFPTQSINVHQLPAYLPPTIPVGPVSVDSKIPATDIFTTGSLYYWTIKIIANTSNTYRLPPVLQQIKSNSTIQYFPAESIRQTYITQGKTVSEVKHVIPFKILSSGIFQLPILQLQYFDPDSGTIKSSYYRVPKAYALSLFWKASLSFILSILAIVILTKLYQAWTRWKSSAEKILRAKELLHNAENLSGIKDSLKLIAEAEHWPVNTTLTQWQKCWSEKYISNKHFTELITEISEASYKNNEDINFSRLGNEFLNVIQTRKRIRRFDL